MSSKDALSGKETARIQVMRVVRVVGVVRVVRLVDRLVIAGGGSGRRL